MSTKRSLLIGFGGLILVGGIIAGLRYYQYRRDHPAPKAFGQVGNYRATQSDIDELRKGTTLSVDNAITALLDVNLYRQAAQSVGVTLTQKEIDAEYSKRTGNKILPNFRLLQTQVESDLLKKRMEPKALGSVEGRIVIVSFDQHLPIEGTNSGITSLENPKFLDQYRAFDRANADRVITNVTTKLRTKEIDFNKAMQIERDDSAVGIKALPTSLHSGAFSTGDKLDPYYGFVNTLQVSGLISKTGTGKMSDKTLYLEALSDKPKAELGVAKWLIIQVDTRNKLVANSLEEFLTAQKKKLNYKKYK